MNNWKIKLSIFINYFLFAILLNSVGTVILQVQNTFGVTESSAAVLEAFKDLSIAFVSFLVASYLTRIGYKNSMLLALLIVTIACLGMPLVNQFWMTKLLFAAVGASFALIKVSVYATIGLVVKDKSEHISLMNFIESFFMVGIMSSYFIFGAFIDDNNPQSDTWIHVYYLLAGLAVLAFLLLFTTPVDESSIQKSSDEKSMGGFSEMFQLIVVPVVLVFVASAFIYVLIEQSIMSWLPTFNSKVLHLPSTLSIQMASILAASTAIGRFLAGVVLKKIKWLTVLICCVLLAGALVLLALPLAQNLGSEPITGWGNAPLVAFIFPMIGLVIAPIYPAINSVILSSLPTRQHGVMSGLIVIFSALGGTTGSLITGYIFEHYGGQSAFYFSLIPMTLLIICLIFFNKLSVKGN
ncbi:MFS transporter [Arcicella sp. LKC2W]|uniref:MFS transporter n=1 Tax=Arcicella sp. LKC2W TaxID=2984198 RepID=UPI002B211982|nr:MFS transporter [Arcicella sp. LKC2W]MEA5460027.1 MFS transporter [Arcicella sp. LKC2W]